MKIYKSLKELRQTSRPALYIAVKVYLATEGDDELMGYCWAPASFPDSFIQRIADQLGGNCHLVEAE